MYAIKNITLNGRNARVLNNIFNNTIVENIDNINLNLYLNKDMEDTSFLENETSKVVYQKIVDHNNRVVLNTTDETYDDAVITSLYAAKNNSSSNRVILVDDKTMLYWLDMLKTIDKDAKIQCITDIDIFNSNPKVKIFSSDKIKKEFSNNVEWTIISYNNFIVDNIMSLMKPDYIIMDQSNAEYKRFNMKTSLKNILWVNIFQLHMREIRKAIYINNVDRVYNHYEGYMNDVKEILNSDDIYFKNYILKDNQKLVRYLNDNLGMIQNYTTEKIFSLLECMGIISDFFTYSNEKYILYYNDLLFTKQGCIKYSNKEKNILTNNIKEIDNMPDNEIYRHIKTLNWVSTKTAAIKRFMKNSKKKRGSTLIMIDHSKLSKKLQHVLDIRPKKHINKIDNIIISNQYENINTDFINDNNITNVVIPELQLDRELNNKIIDFCTNNDVRLFYMVTGINDLETDLFKKYIER